MTDIALNNRIKIIGALTGLTILVDRDKVAREIVENLPTPTTVGVRYAAHAFVLAFKEGRCFLTIGEWNKKDVDMIIASSDKSVETILSGKTPYSDSGVWKNRKFFKLTLRPLIDRIIDYLECRVDLEDDERRRAAAEIIFNHRMYALPELFSYDSEAKKIAKKLINGEVELRLGKNLCWTIIIKDYSVSTEPRSAEKPVAGLEFVNAAAYLDFATGKISLRESVALGAAVPHGYASVIDALMREDRRIKFFS